MAENSTSTISIQVRTGQAAAELAKLRDGLVSVAAAADKIASKPITPPSVAQEAKNATKGLEKFTTAMDDLEASSTRAAGVQIRLSRTMGQARASARIALEGTLQDVKNFNKKLDSTELAAEARRVQEMRGRQAKYLARMKAVDDARLAQAKLTNATLLKTEEASRAAELAALRADIIARSEQQKAADKIRVAAEANVQKQLAALRKHAIAELTALEAGYRGRGSIASKSVFAEMLLREEAQDKAAFTKLAKTRAALISALTAPTGAPKASQTLFADMLRQQDRVGSAMALQQIASLTAPSGMYSAKSSALAQVLREEDAAAKLAARSAAQLAKEQSMLTRDKAALSRATNSNTGILKANSAAMRDVHGAARGLSGSLGTLWMTYGAIAPLMAGAALGTMARSTYGVGKDLQYRLRFVEALGGNSVSTDELMPAVLGSMKTPLEAAEAMQALAQAGMSANDSLTALNTVMTLSTLGELGMEEASISVTAALNAFNLEATEASRVGDVFARAASVSTTSVSKIAESMKQASTNAAQFGITLEETSAALVVMAERNITGSMAGTAFRNMTKELYTPIARGAKVMKELGLSAYNSMGQMKPFQQVLGELKESLYGLDEASRNSALEAIFGERGSRAIKPILEDLDDYVAKVKDLEGAAGFLANANAKLINTVEGAANRLQSTVQQSYASAFSEVEGSVRRLILALDSAAASEQFISFVSGLANGLITLTDAALRSSDVLLNLLKVYAVWKGSQIALSTILATATNSRRAYQAILDAETRSLNQNTLAQSQNNAAKASSYAAGAGGLWASFTRAAPTASRALSILFGVVSRLNVVIGLGATAYMAYQFAMSRTARQAAELRDAGRENLDVLLNTVEALEKEAELLDQTNAKRRGGRTADDDRTVEQRLFDNAQQDLEIHREVEKSAAATLQRLQERLQSERTTLEIMRAQGASNSDIITQRRIINDLQIKEEAAAQRLLHIQEGIKDNIEGQARARKALVRIEEGLRLSRNLTTFEDQLSAIRQFQDAHKEDLRIIEHSTSEERRAQARRQVAARTSGYGAALLAFNVEGARAGVDKKDYASYSEDLAKMLLVANEAVDSTKRSVDFTPAKKGRRDYNDPNYILERMNADAAKLSLKETGDLRKAELAVMRDQEKALLRLREQYMTDEQIAGLRAREQAEQRYNAILDRREALLLDLEQAEKKATDPVQKALARQRMAAIQGDIAAIQAVRDRAGDDAYVRGAQQYLLDNTAEAGVEKLFVKYRNEALKTGDVIANALETSFGHASEALEQFATSGKLSFRDFTVSVLNDLSKMAMKMATNHLFGMIANFASSAIGQWRSGINLSGVDGSGLNLSNQGSFNAKGNAFSAGNLIRFARGGAFTNAVTTGTNVAPMAMFGEAGPEAIMPLTRTSGGELGVKAVPFGAQGGNNLTIHTAVTVNSDGSSKSDSKGSNSAATKLGKELNFAMEDAIRRHLGQGGLIRQAINGR